MEFNIIIFKFLLYYIIHFEYIINVMEYRTMIFLYYIKLFNLKNDR